MVFSNDECTFPEQKVPNSKKSQEEWYAACCDFIISRGLSIRNKDELEVKYDIVNGKIPDSFYDKILNPYNATQDKYKRFPATMRNYDFMKGIIRRYVGEYIKNPHDFIVSANNPEVILARNGKLKQELSILVQQQIAAKINEAYQQFINEGNDPKQFNPEQVVDIENFIKEFNENYIDEISMQGQELLNVIRDLTEDTLLYVRAYFDFITFGECYTYTDIVGKNIVKRVISPRDAFPINTDNMFREDDDMFACRRKLSYQQIMDEFGEHITPKQKDFLNKYYGNRTPDTRLTYNTYESYFPEVCKKFSDKDRNLFRSQSNMMIDNNTGLYDVWHVVWRGFERIAIVTYINESGFIDTRIETDDYKLQKELGDISIEYKYKPQVYECVRIGTRSEAIYPYKARAIAYDRNGKLPYNGINELLQGFGKFSIVEIVTPFQVFYNIVAYHREIVIAKNKLNILMLAKSLLGKNSEDTIYKMIADGVLYIDDTEDSGMLRSQQVRYLQSNLGDYIAQLTALLADIKESANQQVDMTAQRYGEIANSAGKSVTQEAINRGSMGSVIIEYIMDCMRERDYARDLDYSKLAWIDGLDTSFRDSNNNLKYISLNVDNHVYADYVIKCKNSSKEQEKLDALKQFAFNASQNGDPMMAVAAIEGDNVASISKLIKKFQEQKEAHEMQLQQMEQQTKQMEQEFELQKIQVKGEEDRKTKELEGYIDQQIELIRADSNMISYNAEVSDEAKEEGLDRLQDARNQLDREKLQLERQKIMLDTYNKQQDRAVKLKDIDTKYKIAKTNKNKYDKK